MLAARSSISRKAQRAICDALENRRLLSGTGLTAQYFTTPGLTGLKVVQTDPQVNFNWGNTAPVTGVPANNFSVRWEGFVEAAATGTYTFSTTVKDGVRLWVNANEIINDWADHSSPVTDNGTTAIAMNAGTMYPIKMEFYNDSTAAAASLSYSSSTLTQEVIPEAELFPLTTAAAAYTPTTPNTTAPVATGSGLPSGWTADDIGAPSAAGSSTYASGTGTGGTYTVSGGGTLINGVNDAFQYAYRSLSGDFTMITRLDTMTNPNNGAEAGIEVRTGLTGSNREFFIGEQPSGRTYFITRNLDGATETNYNAATAVGAEYLRIQRSGDQLVSSYSTDDVNWSYGSDATLDNTGTTIYAGLAVASRATTTCTATFDAVTFTSPVSNNTTSEIGNSFVGAENHVPLFAGTAYVDPTSGQLYLSGSDEDKGLTYINSDGTFDTFGNTSHYEAGNAIGEDSTFIYDGQAGHYTTGLNGVQRYDHYGIAVGTPVLGSDVVTGIATGGGNIYMATDGMVYVYSASTFAFTGTCFEVPRAGNMAVDPSGNLWVIQNADGTHAAQVGHYSSTGTALSGTITFPSGTFSKTVVPTGIAVDLRTGSTSGQVYISDIGQLQQVDIFNSDGTFNKTFGAQYGIYGGTVPGAFAANKFNYPVGVGLDSSGDIYVVNAGAPEQWGGSTTGTDDIIEKFTAGGNLLWQKSSTTIYETVAADPASPTNVYSRFSSFTSTTATGTNPSVTNPSATFTGTLVNPFAHPDDPRLVGTGPVSPPVGTDPPMSVESPRVGTEVRDIGGTKFLFDFDQHNSAVNVYRFLPGTNTTVFCDAIQTETNRYYTDRTCVWVDANGDGTRQASEETFTADAPKYATNLYVDTNGNIWMDDDDYGHGITYLREFKLNTTTPILTNGALNYSASTYTQYAIPSAFYSINRFTYDAANDAMYITGFTSAPTGDGGYSSGKVMMKYAGWVGGNNGASATASWTTNITYTATSPHVNDHSFYVAGGYIFAERDWADDGVDVYSAATGSLITTLYPSAATGGGNGAETDFQNSITAVQMPNGQFTIYAEADEEAHELVYVWSPTQTVPYSGWVAQDIGTPTAAGSSSYDPVAQQWTVNGGGIDIANASDQFQFDSQTVTGDSQIIAHVTSFTNTNSNSKGGIMFRNSNAVGAAYVALLDTPGTGLRLQFRASDGTNSGNATVSGITEPNWLKLTRTGNVITGYYSSDGITYTQIGSPITVTMSPTALVGLSVCVHAPSTGVATMTYTNVSIGVPLISQDIGSPAHAGSASYDQYQNQWTVVGGGADIYGTSDQGQFVTENHSGDVTLITKVDSLVNTSNNAKAGLTIRDSSAANAINAHIVVTPGGGVQFQWRSTTGGSTSQAAISGIVAPTYLKLVRSGSSFSGYYSADGVTWTQVGSTQTITLATNAVVGLCVTAADNTKTTTAVFEDLSIA